MSVLWYTCPPKFIDQKHSIGVLLVYQNYLCVNTNHLGIKKHIKHHLFRKTFATHLIQGGADIIAVGDLCRHRSPRTTLRFYAAVNTERSKDKHQEILGRILVDEKSKHKQKERLMEFERWVSMEVDR